MSKDGQELNLESTGNKPAEDVTSAKTENSLDIGIAGIPPLNLDTLEEDFLKQDTGKHPAAAVTATTASITKDLILDSYAEERVAACIASFVGGHAAGWFFLVPEAFKDSLDIQPTQRVFHGKTHNVMTQGKLFSFGRGDVIYANRGNSRFCVQVKDATPAKSVKTKDYETLAGIQILEDKSQDKAGEKKPKKDLYRIKFTRFQTDYGFVRFGVFDIDESGRFTLRETYETNQELFVRFLQTGLLRCNDGTEHDFTSDMLPDPRCHGM